MKGLERGGEGGMDISLFGMHIMSFLLFTLRATRLLETPGWGGIASWKKAIGFSVSHI